ncbi:MAG TPA: TolC family protein [Candidatus Xenobia bacterium]|nr:TolC family protein [Candidatus Xenobia bacterium]
MMTASLRRCALSLLLAGLLALPLPAQTPLPDYSKGNSHIPNLVAPYTPKPVSPPNLANSPRLDDLIRDGKLYLSLQDAIYLAIENNLDIATARYDPATTATTLLSARGGPVIGGVGGGFNRVGGASLDPLITTSLGIERNRFPLNNPFLTGAGTFGQGKFNQDLAIGSFGYTQGFDTGTAFRVSWDSRRNFSNPTGNAFNPSITTGLYLGISQPLLNGFGRTQNARAIRVAKNNILISDQTFLQNVMDVVSNVKRSYWELVFAIEDVKVKEQSVALAEKLYEDNKRQVEIGTLAPIEVVRAEAEVARTRQDLIISQTNLRQQQTLLKDQITKNPLDPLVALVEIVPTDHPDVPLVPEILPIQDAIQVAMEKRPEVIAAQLDIKNRNLDSKAAKQALLPGMEVYAFYGGNGLGGFFFNPNTNTLVEDSGLSRSITRAWQADFADYGFGLNISLPIKNRVAQAESARAQIAQRQAETRYQRTINTVVVEVRNAQIAMEQNLARVEAARKNTRLAQETYDAEQKKFQLGASTIFLVIQAQRDLAQARSGEVRAMADFERSRVDFDRALGRTMERNNITIDDAKAGMVNAASTPPPQQP